MTVQPGAEPYDAQGSGDLGRVGVLVLHGFTGSPVSMRPWAEHLAAAGLTVRLPRLPGHGTSWQDMTTTRWPDWYGEAERSFDALAAACEAVFVVGLSMGGTLTLRLAEEKAGTVRGVVTVNASLVSPDPRMRALPLLKLVVPSLAGIGNDMKKEGVDEGAYARVPLRALASLLELQRLTLADLGRITCPVLAFRSRVDHVVAPQSGEFLRSRTASGRVEEHVLEDSYHVATLDNDAAAIFAGSLDFVRAGLAAPAA